MSTSDEVVYDSERTRITRVYPADGSTPIIRKQPLGRHAAERLRHEMSVLQRLDDVEGVARLATGADPGSLDLVDADAYTLASLPTPWDVGPLIELARRLAGALAAIHRHGVVHRDVSPANILIPVDGGGPILIDFELSSSSTTSTDDAEDNLGGTLPYLAPEQTGRTGRPVDHRADLYALGATLYELETGEPPFGRDRDPLRLVHDHLARVPAPPNSVNGKIPAILSDITMKLLSKEPEQRYQSGEGLAHDLAHVTDGTAFPLGDRDFPLRLAPPSTLVGRDAPLATLRGMFAEAVAGNRGVALVTGPPGVGKTALIDRLRPAVAAAHGRFVTGKFDQYRRDLGADAVKQAFTALGAQLLAEPEDEVTLLRDRLLAALGANAGLAAALIPPFAALLGVPPEEGTDDPRTAAARLRQMSMSLLRTVASSVRPVVFFLDDLQWAGLPAFGFLDSVLDEPDLPGVLVLGAFREADVDEAHPLTATLNRLRRTGGELRLDNLPPGDLGSLLAEMLRLPGPDASPLADLLGARTGGNPFDTVELVNALRREGALVPDGDGWTWDPDTLRRFVGRGDVVDLLGTRIEQLPAAGRDLIEVLACLGGEVEMDLLRVASGQDADAIGLALLPAAEDGLIVVSRESTPTVSFRHDRVQQAAYARLDDGARARIGLAAGRRLAGDPRFVPAAAQQYLTGLDLLTDPDERRTVAGLLRARATTTRMVSNHVATEALLAAALSLLGPGAMAVRAEWHAALCALGRFDEADTVFAELETAGQDPVRHAAVVCEQVVGYTNRGLVRQALDLGLAQLAPLGLPVPDELGPEIDEGLSTMYAWLAADDPEQDLRDPRLLAAARVINRSMPPAFFCDKAAFAWLAMRAGEIWIRHGAAAALVGPFAHAGFVTVPLRGDYSAGYRAVRRIIATAEARGYGTDTAQAKFLQALGLTAWFEPAEHAVRLGHEAHDGLLRGGDLQNAASVYYATLPPLLDCGPDLDGFGEEAEAALALCERIGYGHAAATYVSYRQLRKALQGTGTFTDAGFDEDAHLAAVADNPTAAVNFHVLRGLSAAIFGDDEALARHAAAAMPLLPTITSTYPNMTAHLLAALGGVDPGGSREFLAARAADQPGNFRHLLRLVEAEDAVREGDFAAAAKAYDAAARDALDAGRPWHAGLICERAGRFFLANDMEQTGGQLLAHAYDAYARWGATGKIRQFSHVSRASLTTSASVNVSTEALDMLAVLEAARVLSSETDLDRLRVRVAEVLSAVSGATEVHVVLDDAEGWTLPATDTHPAMPLADAAGAGLLPLSALRYAERTREPMLVDDVSRDDRVARDPYFAGLDHCSLLVVPVLSQGVPKAILILENRLTRRAFSSARLDSVLLIAGQLTVSLDNAMLYASLERKVAERTEELAAANRLLEQLTVTDPLTGLANRRRLTDALDAEWTRALRTGLPIGLAMIDIDVFKKYNDHYGHQGGDSCLRQVARTIASHVRASDLVARYGGEEFSIVMPETDSAGACLVATRVCQEVAALGLPHALAENGIVTISVGVTAFAPMPGGHPDSLIKNADEALYEAKRGGRNRVAVG